MPPDKLELSPTMYLPGTDGRAERYQVLTVLSQGRAQVIDEKVDVRSPLQSQLPKLITQDLATLQQIPDLPAAAYPYLLLPEAAPPIYDAWQQGETALIITPERPTFQPLIKAFSTAVDPLQHVYWMYRFTELWEALEPVPLWRSSLLHADNLCIDTDQSLRIQRFITPGIHPPQLSALKAFLQSLLAQPHRGEVAALRQIRRLILAVSSADTLKQLSEELASIGEELLSTPAAITPRSNIAAEPTTGVSTASPMPMIEDPWNNALDDSLPDTSLPDTYLLDTEKASATETMDSGMESDAQKPDQGSDQTLDQAPEQDSDRMIEESDDRLLEETLLMDAATSVDSAENSDSTMVLPMKLVSLEEAGQTDVGRQRDHNEDCFSISSSLKKQSDNSGQKTQAHCLYILCDGMGGHEGGEIASRLAAETLIDYFKEHWPHPLPTEEPKPLPTEAVVVEAVKLANQAIFEVNEKEHKAGHERMGTTLVMVLLQGTSAVVAHVGDSRLYQHTRRLGLSQATVDHEVGQREIQRGVEPEMAYARPDAYQLTQALGPRRSDELAPSVRYLNFSEDTLLLLCSDGLSDNDLVEDYLETHIDPLLRGRKALETGVNDLIGLGNEVNGHDNITAIAVCLKVSPDLNSIR